LFSKATGCGPTLCRTAPLPQHTLAFLCLQLEAQLHPITRTAPLPQHTLAFFCLQLEAQLHPITRTVLRIQLTITPAFTWKDG
jgi:hypothetical protein